MLTIKNEITNFIFYIRMITKKHVSRTAVFANTIMFILFMAVDGLTWHILTITTITGKYQRKHTANFRLISSLLPFPITFNHRIATEFIQYILTQN